ncbi:hypothetical protein FQN54_004935 [Arachnomyces sp. PD_36]|nr:hypothetical protein FQN54_004935 [Arachnomyces sp. PD_36]
MVDPKVNPAGDLPILIIGAGPGGLALAQGLRKRNIKYRIFERDIDSEARGQGWAIAVHWVIPDLLRTIPDDLPPIETISHLYDLGLDSEAVFFDGVTCEERIRHGPQSAGTFLRADRLKLREWLSGGIDIEWNKRFEGFTEGEGSVTARFADGSTAEGRMLIGADGAMSKVRAQLLGPEKAATTFLPMDVYIGNVSLTKAQYEQQFAEFARSCYAAETKSVFLFVGLHTVAPDHENADYYWMVMRHHSDMECESGHSTAGWSNERLYEAALHWVNGLHPKFQEIVRLSSLERMVQVPSFMDTWSPPENGFSTGRVTLLGDAVHKLTPFYGQGVNHALQDCVDFCQMLDSGGDVQDVIKQYEKKVIPRGREAVRATTEAALHWK